MNEGLNVVIKGSPLKLTHNYPFRIGFISDLHVGAQHGIFPPNFVDVYDKLHELNKGQKILWKYFEDFMERLRENKVNVLVVLGDVVGGQNWKEHGAYMMMTEMEIQTDACAFLLKTVTERVPSIEKIMLFKGTPYHGSRDVVIENVVANKLGRMGINAEYRGEYSYIILKYGENEKVLWVAHPATGATVYPETVLGRDIGQFLQAYGMGKLPKVDMIIRAHRHEFMELHKSSIRYMVLPCWEFYVPYDKAVEWFAKWQPDIGGAILLADEQCRIRPWHFTYPNVVNPQRFITVRSEKEYGLNNKKLG